MTNTLADAITAHLDEMGQRATTDYAEQVVEGHRADLDYGRGLVRLALELDLDPQLPCYTARADDSRPCGPFDTMSEANTWIGYDDRYEVEQITIGDAARLFPACAVRTQEPPTPLVALLTLPARFTSLVGA